MKKLKLILVLMLFFNSGVLYAVDESIYYGKWKLTVHKNDMTLILKRGEASVWFDDKEHYHAIKYEYTYSNLSPYPFLSVVFNDEADVEHLLYLLVGDSTDDTRSSLIGFYEKTKIIDNSHGEMESVTYKVEFINSAQQ